MCDYGTLNKTLLTYLIISLVNLNESKYKKTSKKIKMACSVFSECLGRILLDSQKLCFLSAVLINKRVSSVLALNNALLSVLVSLDLRRVHWSKRQSIIIGKTAVTVQSKVTLLF